MDEFRSKVVIELRRLSEDILYTEKAHFAAAETLRFVRLSLGVAATVASTASAASVVAKQNSWLSGALALTAAALTAVLTFVKPEESSRTHQATGVQLGALRVRLRLAIELGPQGVSDVEQHDWRETVSELSSNKAEIDSIAPPLSARHFDAARKKIRRGDFKHDGV